MRMPFIDTLWYKRHPLRWILYPFSLVYQIVAGVRRYYLQHVCQQSFPVPVIVVGNLTVGGVGKTPLVIALAQHLHAQGLRVGIVSRGYGSTVKTFPHEVDIHQAASLVGDEPLLIAKKTQCPVVIAPNRVKAVQFLLDKYQCQIILSDDGLQHYRMGRAIEIAVIDGLRELGNGLCLPAGPLREGKKRLQDVDLIVVNGGSRPGGYPMNLQPGRLTQLVSGATCSPSALTSSIAAVAAIGHPQRFFATLDALGMSFTPYPFADHHAFQERDLQFSEKIVVMTEKDAVKCSPFASEGMYFLPVDAEMSNEFWDALWSYLPYERLQQ